eukprot:TRINITY_DN2376_c0_g1_i1.p1 TRINITY_DN2376_c0_g1~~TRINITY_DN2376_c0_g1_i1.p1  ORF type:complete len:395 (+),score=62.24 TRINITY_DN2376_c0_g1_i1:114-1298(+)
MASYVAVNGSHSLQAPRALPVRHEVPLSQASIGQSMISRASVTSAASELRAPTPVKIQDEEAETEAEASEEEESSGRGCCYYTCASGGWACGTASTAALVYVLFGPQAQMAGLHSSPYSLDRSTPAEAEQSPQVEKLRCFPLDNTLPPEEESSPTVATTCVPYEEAVSRSASPVVRSPVSGPSRPSVSTLSTSATPSSSSTAPLAATTLAQPPSRAATLPPAMPTAPPKPPGECTNDHDLKRWKQMGIHGYTTMLHDCAVECWGRGDCVAGCFQKKKGYSANCASCFGDTPVCTMKSCFMECVSNGPKCPACSTEKCVPGFVQCAGLNPSDGMSFTPNWKPTVAPKLRRLGEEQSDEEPLFWGHIVANRWLSEANWNATAAARLAVGLEGSITV